MKITVMMCDRCVRQHIGAALHLARTDGMMNGIKGENIMQTERIDREIVRGLHILWKDLHTFHQAAQFLIIGAAGTLFLCIWNFYIAAVMGISTIIVYFLAKKWRGWQNTLLWMGFPVFVFVICTYVLVVGFSLYLDFPPNGAENYGRIRHSFFPKEIPATAYDVQVWSSVGFGQGTGEAYLSFRDTKENILKYAEFAQHQKDAYAKYDRDIGMPDIPQIIVDETSENPRFAVLPFWERLILDYTPHPVERKALGGEFTFYIWDVEDRWNHPKAKVIAVSDDGTHIIFYALGE